MADEQSTPLDVPGFWSWFAGHHRELEDIVLGRRAGRATELLDHALTAHGLSLTYELERVPDGVELSFTLAGDPELGPFVDYFVAKAPPLPGWRIFGRIQRRPLPTALAFVRAIHRIDLAEANFKLVLLDDRYHLCFLHDELHARTEDERWSIAGTFLDHALGEEVAACCIGDLDFRPSAPGVQLSLLVNELIRETERTDTKLEAPNLGPAGPRHP